MPEEYEERQPSAEPAVSEPVSGAGAFSAQGRPWRLRNRNTGEVRYWSRRLGTYTPNPIDVLDTVEAQDVALQRQGADKARRDLRSYGRLAQLNETTRDIGSLGTQAEEIVATGVQTPWGNFGLGNVARLQPFPDQTTAQHQEFLALTKELAPQQREPGSGATSDYDARTFEMALPGRDKQRDTNRRILSRRIEAAQQAVSFADFLEWYVSERGTTFGARDAWGNYLATPRRTADWRVHFDARTPTTQGRRPAIPQEDMASINRHSRLVEGYTYVTPSGRSYRYSQGQLTRVADREYRGNSRTAVRMRLRGTTDEQRRDAR